MTNPTQTNESAMTLEQAFEHGVSLYQHQKKGEAREVFEQILNHAPDAVPVLQVLAVLDSEEGQWQAALKKLDHALSVSPGDASILFDKAHLLAQHGANKEALEIVDALLDVAPTNQELLALRQQLTAATGQRGESRRTAKQMDAVSTQKQSALKQEVEETLSLAGQMVATGNLDQAKLLFNAVMNVAGDVPAALLGVAKIYLGEEKYGLARQHLLRAFEQDNSDKETVVLLSHSAIKIDDYPAARTHARFGLQHWPEDAIFCRLLVLSFEKEQNWLEAYRQASGFIKQHPEDADLLNRLATASFQLLRARHNFTPAAITACQKHIQQAARVATPENKQRLSTYLAEVLWYKGEANTSKALLEEYIAQHPQDIEAGFNISFVYRTLGEWENYYRANELGITCNRRLQYNGNVPQWNLERPKDDVVLVMPEQGVGDEILYFHNLAMVLENAKKVYVACDPRLEDILSRAYPEAVMVPVKRDHGQDIDIPESVLSDITAWVAGGSLAGICFANFGRHIYQSPYIKLAQETEAHWQSQVAALRKANPDARLVGICWRSGLAAATRNIHYLVAEEAAHLVKQCPDTVFVNLQYGDCRKELNKIEKLSGVRIVQLDGLDLRDDFEGTAAVIKALDAVVTAGTAVHRLTTAVGTPCHVFFAGTEASDFTQPQTLNSDSELGYFYPPMLENKYPLLETIARQIQAI
ncbi:tetratricopeptide repeat protein [Enterovibrio paralichthyis]|uniref:tetratricopeptide repeat protein n=1 Tax=Enterovibrio paralichthyis TaxID=2853805 RepID=UPI001C47451A|nr:tetratricopeptide repeat protein [Enterovibrio paralichthyis]MBV7298536.1 tetratricopeptide repeat protein [Enterovibrio paralichthyis]